MLKQRLYVRSVFWGLIFLVLSGLSCGYERNDCMSANKEARNFVLIESQVGEKGTVRFIETPDEKVYLFMGEGDESLLRLDVKKSKPAWKGHVDEAAITRDGKLVYISEGSIWLVDDIGRPNRKNVTDEFSGKPAAKAKVVCTLDGSVWVEGCRNRRMADGSFEAVAASIKGKCPVPLATDIYGNRWSFVTSPDGKRVLAVIGGQGPFEWMFDSQSGVGAGDWKFLIADEMGLIWVADSKKLYCFSPRNLARGPIVFTVSDGLADSEITALAESSEGNVLVGFASGQVAECRIKQVSDEDKTINKIVSFIDLTGDISEPVRALHTDLGGRVWVAMGTKVGYVPAASDAWQKTWKLGARIPYSDHDLCGITLEDKFYIAGGLTADYGYPGVSHDFDEIFVYDPAVDVWKVAAKLSRQRVYNAIETLGGKVWIINGYHREDGKMVSANTVEIYDPKTGKVEMGPSTKFARQKPIAGTINDRIYIVGCITDEGDSIGQMESIGEGEKQWRLEPASPIEIGPMAGCVLDGKLYLSVLHYGLLSFEPATGKWDADIPKPPQVPRSPQMAAYRGEVWVMGGVQIETGLELYRYDPVKRSWQSGPAFPVRHMAWGAGGVLKDQLIFAGGAFARYHTEDFKRYGSWNFSNRMFVLREDALK